MSEKLTAAEYRTAAKVQRARGWTASATDMENQADKLEAAEREAIPETAWEKYAEAVDGLVDKLPIFSSEIAVIRAADPRRNPPAPVKDEPALVWHDVRTHSPGPLHPVKDEPTKAEIMRTIVDCYQDPIYIATLRRVWADKLQEGV